MIISGKNKYIIKVNNSPLNKWLDRPSQSYHVWVCVHKSHCGLLGLWPALSHASCVRSSASSLCWNSATIAQCPLPQKQGPYHGLEMTRLCGRPQQRLLGSRRWAGWAQSSPIVPWRDKTGIQTFHSCSIFSRPWRNLRYEPLQPRQTFQRLFRGAWNNIVFWALAWATLSRIVGAERLKMTGFVYI